MANRDLEPPAVDTPVDLQSLYKDFFARISSEDRSELIADPNDIPGADLFIQNFSTAMAEKKWDIAFDSVLKANPQKNVVRALLLQKITPDLDFSDNKYLLLFLLLTLLEFDLLPARDPLITLAKIGNPIAQFILGKIWQHEERHLFLALDYFKKAAEQNFNQAIIQLQVLLEKQPSCSSFFLDRPESTEINFFSWLRKSTAIDIQTKRKIAVSVSRFGSPGDILQPSPSIVFYAALILLEKNTAATDPQHLRVCYLQIAGCVTFSDQQLSFHKLLRQETPTLVLGPEQPTLTLKALDLLPANIKDHVVARETAFWGVFYHILDQKKCSITRHFQLPAPLINHILSFLTPIPVVYHRQTSTHIKTLKCNVAEKKQSPQTMLSSSTFFGQPGLPNSLDEQLSLFFVRKDPELDNMITILSHAKRQLAPDQQVQLDDALLSILATIPRRGFRSVDDSKQNTDKMRNGITTMLNTRTSPLSIALLSARPPARPFYSVMSISPQPSLYDSVWDKINAISKEASAKKSKGEEKKEVASARPSQLSIVC